MFGGWNQYQKTPAVLVLEFQSDSEHFTIFLLGCQSDLVFEVGPESKATRKSQCQRRDNFL